MEWYDVAWNVVSFVCQVWILVCFVRCQGLHNCSTAKKAFDEAFEDFNASLCGIAESAGKIIKTEVAKEREECAAESERLSMDGCSDGMFIAEMIRKRGK